MVNNSVITNASRFIETEFNRHSYFGFESVFPSILVLDLIVKVENHRLDRVKSRLLNQLKSHLNDQYSLNYWRRDVSRYISEPYPDDMDDTACGLAAIYQYDPDFIGADVLAKLVSHLIHIENKPGGPYGTWIVPKSNLTVDLDLAVNCNIAYLLSFFDIELEGIDDMVEHAIKAKQFLSKYYVGELPVLYFISRIYSGKNVAVVSERVIEILTQSKVSSLDLALGIGCLLRLSVDDAVIRELHMSLLERQLEDGSWESCDLYFQSRVQGSKDIDRIGSCVLTTAFALDAICRFDRLNCNSSSHKTGTVSLELTDYVQSVRSAISVWIESLPSPIDRSISDFVDDFFAKPVHEMVIGTPLFVSSCFGKNIKQTIDDSMLHQCSLINVYGWCAYLIYDDIIDRELLPDYLPAANVFCREMDRLLCKLVYGDPGLTSLYLDVMNGIENANCWELQECRFYPKIGWGSIPAFDDVKSLSERSLGHALSSLVLLQRYGSNSSKGDIPAFVDFFRYYLAAKQMNDDAHDWVDDLKRGQFNSVGAMVVDGYLKTLSKQKQFCRLSSVRQKHLETFFWKEMVDSYCKKVTRLLDCANSHLKNVKSFHNCVLFDQLLKKEADIVDQALKERDDVLVFVDTFFE